MNMIRRAGCTLRRTGSSFVEVRPAKSGIETHRVVRPQRLEVQKAEQVELVPCTSSRLDASGDRSGYKQLDPGRMTTPAAPGRIPADALQEHPARCSLNDAEANIEKRKQKLPADPRDGPEGRGGRGFEADVGRTRTKLVLAEKPDSRLGLKPTWAGGATPNLVMRRGTAGGQPYRRDRGSGHYPVRRGLKVSRHIRRDDTRSPGATLLSHGDRWDRSISASPI